MSQDEVNGLKEKKKILFVDDEPNVLSGLKRMLRVYRREWEMSFAGSGKEALEMLAREPRDVVVSDMRMPAMDGAEFLLRVQQDYPATIRIILSGHAEVESAMRSALCAHQFLSKPCDSETIRHVVVRSCFLQARLQNETLKRAVGKMESLPAIPRIYNELSMALAASEVELEDVVKIVEQDAGITAKMLQLVNSSFFGIARRVDTLRDALSYLGLNTIKMLTLSYEVFHRLDAGQVSSWYSIEDEQRHAHQVASLAREIMGGRGKGDQAFLAGILHDVGKLVLATNLKDQCDALAAESPGSEEEALEMERRHLGVTHDEVGAYLLGIWGMPFPIVEAVHGHHDLSVQPVQEGLDEIAAVHIADGLVHELTEPDKPSPVDVDFVRSIGKESELAGWRERAAAIVSSSEEKAEEQAA